MSALAGLLALVSAVPAAGSFHPRVATGRYFSLFVEPADNKVFGAGRNDFGQLGNAEPSVKVPTRITFPVGTYSNNTAKPQPKVVSAAAGAFHSLFLTDEGAVWVTGRNQYGQLALADPQDRQLVTEPVEIYASGVRDVAAGYAHSLFLTDTGLYGAGWNVHGQLGLGMIAQRSELSFINLTECSDPCNIQSIAAGYDTSFALIEDGSVWAFGNNFGGQLGIGPTGNYQSTPKQVKQIGANGAYIAVSAGESHTLFSTAGAIYATGANFAGQLGDSSTTSTAEPVAVSFSEDVTAVVAGGDSSCIIGGNDKEPYGFGSNLAGQLGLGNDPFSPTQPTRIVAPGEAGRFRHAALSEFHGLYLDGGGVVFASGSNSYGQLGANSSNASTDKLIGNIITLTPFSTITTTSTVTSTTSTTTTTTTFSTTTGNETTTRARTINSEDGGTDWTLVGWSTGIIVTLLALVVGFVAQGQAAKKAADEDEDVEMDELQRGEMST